MSAMSDEVSRAFEQAPFDLSDEGSTEEEHTDYLLSSTAARLDFYAYGAEALRSLVIGHKKALIDAGFCDATAEEMSVGLHDSIAQDFFDE